MRKQVDITATLRRAIRSGKYKPGARLPTVRELTASTGAGLPTAHRAMTTLVEQGFICTDGRNGTHVVAHPPHRHRFALVMPERPAADGRYPSRLPQALAEAAAAITRPDRRIAIHHGLNQHPELPEHRLLVEELAAGMLAGVVAVDVASISAWIGPALAGVPLIAAPGTDVPIIACLSLYQFAIVEQALDEAVAVSRRRLAFIGDATGTALRYVPGLRAGASARHLDLPPCRIRAASLACPAWATLAVEGCWDPLTGDPPDALIVLDDNLVDAAVVGLRAMGRRAADTLLIHLTNFPSAPTTWRPLVRIGWDQREVLGAALDRLAAAHQRPAASGDITAPLHLERLA